MANEIPTTPLEIMFKLLGEVRDALEEGRERERQLERSINQLSTKVSLLRQSFDTFANSHSNHPPRIEKLERYIWVVTLLFGAVGVVGGGVLQSIISDQFRRDPTPYQQTHRGP